MADVTIRGRTYPGITDIKIGSNYFKSTAETITYPGLENVNTYTHSADWTTGKTLTDFITQYFGNSNGGFLAFINNNTASGSLDEVAYFKSGSTVSACVMRGGKTVSYAAATSTAIGQINAPISTGATITVYTFSSEA